MQYPSRRDSAGFYFSVYKVEFIPLGDSQTFDIEHLGIRKDFVKAVQLGLKSLLVSEAL